MNLRPKTTGQALREGASLSPRRVGKGSRDWGEIQWIVQVDRSGENDGSGNLDAFVTMQVLLKAHRRRIVMSPLTVRMLCSGPRVLPVPMVTAVSQRLWMR